MLQFSVIVVVSARKQSTFDTNLVLVFQAISPSPETTGKHQNENFSKILSIYTGIFAMIAYQFLCLEKKNKNKLRPFKTDLTEKIVFICLGYSEPPVFQVLCTIVMQNGKRRKETR